METSNLALVTKKIYDSSFSCFTLKTLKDILEIKKESTLFKVIGRLIESRVLLKIEKDKYLLFNNKLHDFTLANFIYQPSYISFESALNFYGILSQFPYEITSCTSRKTKQKEIKEKIFSYVHIQKDLFWGYELKDKILIAFPEKALLDQIYLTAKGLKKINFDELDYSFVNRQKFKTFLNKYPKTRQFIKTMATLKYHFKI